MSRVFVIDTNKRPLDPVHPGQARLLVSSGRAAVWRMAPFTIILKEAVPEAPVKPLRVKLDPGSRKTGLAIVDDETGQIVFAAELEHRGRRVKARLDRRRALRRGRRARKTRYRKPRFDNRTRPKGWLPPSLESRVANCLTWVERLRRLCPVSDLTMELVRFDTHLMQEAEVSGVLYQQGELAGYEVREYLLAKFERTCAYCGETGVPLQIEHIVPRARGGTNRVSNLTLACEPCNLAKGTKTAEEFGHPEVQKLARRPLRDAAAVNATRWALYERLKATGLSVETGSGGLTKYNRTKRGLPKSHWQDAACTGKSTPETLRTDGVRPLRIKACGRGSRQMCGTDKYGFPDRHRNRKRDVRGFRTGDLVRAEVPKGKRAGSHTGRVAVRASGSFRIGGVDGINVRHCHLLQHADGYSYDQMVRNPGGGDSSPA